MQRALPLATDFSSVASRLVAGFSALGAGALLIALVGFVPIAAVHNAAHDTRHSVAFPCH